MFSFLQFSLQSFINYKHLKSSKDTKRKYTCTKMFHTFPIRPNEFLSEYDSEATHSPAFTALVPGKHDECACRSDRIYYLVRLFNLRYPYFDCIHDLNHSHKFMKIIAFCKPFSPDNSAISAD